MATLGAFRKYLEELILKGIIKTIGARKCRGVYMISIPEARYVMGHLFLLSGKEWFQVIKEMEKLVPFNFVEVACRGN